MMVVFSFRQGETTAGLQRRYNNPSIIVECFIVLGAEMRAGMIKESTHGMISYGGRLKCGQEKIPEHERMYWAYAET